MLHTAWDLDGLSANGLSKRDSMGWYELHSSCFFIVEKTSKYKNGLGIAHPALCSTVGFILVRIGISGGLLWTW
jgi:hypothetical protein